MMGWKVNDLGAHGAPLAFSHPTAYATEGAQYIVYQGFTVGQGGNGSLHLFEWNSSGWHYGGDLTIAVGAPPADQFTDLTSYVFTGENTQHVDYMAMDGHIYELWFDSDGWHANDLSASANATVSALNGPSGFALAGLQQVFYRGTDLHVQELWWDVAGWHPRDLTLTAGGPLVRASGPTSYGFQAQLTQHVIYVASGQITGGDVHELWRDSHGTWHDGGNLTGRTGAPLADGQPTGYAFEARNTQHIHYRGIDGYIHELHWDSTIGWHYWGNLTAETGAPKAEGNPRGYVFTPQDTQHVVYQGTDGHIHELWWDSNGWHHNDLTIRTGAPLAGSDPTGYVFEFLQDTQHVIYNSADHHIVELVWTPLATNPQILADLTGAGRADIVGFGDEGVWVALGRGDGTFNFPQLAIADFGYVAGGWRIDRHPRLLADLTGNGRADIVGFGNAGVYVALSRGDGTFDYAPQPVVADFGYVAGGWRVDRHPRFLASLTGNGRADIVGFGDAGVYVALSRGDGTFDYSPQPVVADFGNAAGGWRVDRHPRFLADLTGNGVADIVGFGDGGVWVALGRGDGTFNSPQLAIADFGYVAGGWRVDQHPRFLADLTGNGRADIVGFGNAGVYVALSRGDGTFDYSPQPVVADLGYVAGGWRVDRHPRFLADLTGNGRADIVGFGNAGVYVALSRGDGTFDYSPQPVLADFGYDAGGWRVDRNPRFLADLTGNGRADIVGFGDVGVRTALSNGNGTFQARLLAAPDFGYDARAW
jgi:hypothetical protein